MQSIYDSKPWLKSYPQWLPQSLPLPERSVLDEFIYSVENYPDDPCIYYFDNTYSYKEIYQNASALAQALRNMGLQKGDRVICDMQNIPQVVISWLAIWMCSGIVVPLNPMFKLKEMQYYLNDSGAKLVICQEDLYESVFKPLSDEIKELKIITTSSLDFIDKNLGVPTQLASCKKLLFDNTYDLIKLIEENKASTKEISPKKEGPSVDDIAFLVYTSGTTGPPKGAILTHSNIVHNAKVYEVSCRLTREDVILGVAPLFHITGIVAHVAIGFHLGIPIVLYHRFDPKDTFELIQKWKVSFTVAAITVYIALLNHPDVTKYDLSSLTKAYSGGAPVSPSIVEKFKNTVGCYIHNVYGLTESSSPATITPLGLEAPVDEDSGALSVGLIIPGHEAWIVDLDDPSKEVPFGEEGELVLRGPGITKGYWQKPEETNHAIKDGKFHTGDVAKIDEQGWCYIVDRKKDLIVASGFKVWPRDVEDVLYQHPAVKEAAVVGVPDPYRGETVKAVVSLKEGYKTTPEELIEFCKQRMAAYKYPRIVEIVDEVPKTATGKFLRRLLRDKK